MEGIFMEKKNQYPFYECIDMVLKPSDFGYKNNVLIVKHNNTFRKEKDLAGINEYYSFKDHKLKKPYEPFLDIIKEYVVEKMETCKKFSLDDFLDKAKVYPLHKGLLKSYFLDQDLRRQEDIIFGEYKYEKERMKKAIINMYCEVAKKKKECLILDEVNMASVFVIEMLQEISKKPEYFSIKVIAIYNESGGRRWMRTWRK